jgi:bifunctional DNA-binding transcriptional regulator/antitoxin component of YhaV-PrlF toxin-antitoxin module
MSLEAHIDAARHGRYPYHVVRSKAKLTSKGQLTLPLAVRKALNVAAGDVVAFEISPECIVIKTDLPADRFSKFAGRFRVGRGQSADETNEWLREIRGRGKRR